MNEDLIERIPDDLIEGVLFIIDDYKTYSSYAANDQRIDELEYFKEIVGYYFLLEAFLKKFDFPDYDKNILEKVKAEHDLKDLHDFFDAFEQKFIQLHKERSINQENEKYTEIFEKPFSYEFAESDLERVQELINLLRSDISSSELFEADHKRRLLKRLEKLQSELHKKVSDLDRFWGLIGDAGVVIGKFGDDVKPMVDRIREIAGIVWKTQSKSEGLPSGTNIPFLGDDKADK